MPDVLTAGEVLASLRVPSTPAPGSSVPLSAAGAEANVAIGLARLGHDVGFVGVIGDDALGRLVRRALSAEGVSLLLHETAQPTGVIVFTERLPGVTMVDYHRRQSAGTGLDAAVIEQGAVRSMLQAGCRIVHLTGITPALSPTAHDAVQRLAELARAERILVSFDVNYRSKLWSRDKAHPVLRDLARIADIVIASEDELPFAGSSPDDAISELLDAGKQVIIKRGAAGATGLVGDLRVDVDAVPVTTVDAVGAGDAFVAGYLSATLDGLDLRSRLERGCALGAFAVAHRGDWEGLPTRDELHLIGSSRGTTLR